MGMSKQDPAGCVARDGQVPLSRALGKLMGMSEITEKLMLPEKCQSDHTIVQQVTSAANVGRVPCGASNEYR